MQRWIAVLALIPALSCTGSEPVEPDSLWTLTLSGTVSETAPTSRPVAKATVTILEGFHAGQSAITDPSGAFQFPPMQAGTFKIRIDAAGYVEASQSVTLHGVQRINLELDPVFQLVTTTTTGVISNGESGCTDFWDIPPREDPCALDYVFETRHTGEFKAAVTSTDAKTDFTIELYRLGKSPYSSGQHVGDQVDTFVQGRTKYVLHVRKFFWLGGPPPAGSTAFTMTMTRPN